MEERTFAGPPYCLNRCCRRKNTPDGQQMLIRKCRVPAISFRANFPAESATPGSSPLTFLDKFVRELHAPAAGIRGTFRRGARLWPE